MSVCTELVKGVEIPKMVRVKQKFERPAIKEIICEVRKELSREAIRSQILAGMSIAITCGSRGITDIALILREIVSLCKSYGAKPFVIPAMGSHGGATAEGQLEVLQSYGVTEDSVGCPVKSSMDTVFIGCTKQGHRLLIDKHAANADGIIIINRIKAHTAFSGPYESGLMKMITIGLGKQQGAEVCHAAGFGKMNELIPLFANTILEKAPILFGVAIIENAYKETAQINALTKTEIPKLEPELLKKSKALMGRIHLPETDVVIVDKIGKNISGDGTDPHVTGNFGTPYVKGGIASQRWVVLDLTEESHGNANGVGLFDVTTRRLFDKIDMDITYPNAITNTMMSMVKIPAVMACDRDAIAVGIKTCNNQKYEGSRIVRIKTSADIEEILISEQLIDEARRIDNLEIIGEAEPVDFDIKGNLF